MRNTVNPECSIIFNPRAAVSTCHHSVLQPPSRPNISTIFQFWFGENLGNISTKSSNFPIMIPAAFDPISCFIWQYFKVGFVLRFFVHHSGEEEEEAGVGGEAEEEEEMKEREEEEEAQNVDTEHNFTT